MTQEEHVYKVSTEDEISLKDLLLKIGELWKYLLSKWLIIFAMGILGAALGFFYAWRQKPIYTATTTFVLETGEKGGGLGQYAGVASMMGIDLGGGGGGIFQGDNILDLYRSRKMIEKTLFSPIDTVSGQTLLEKYIEFNELREGWEEKPELKNIKFLASDFGKLVADERQQRLRDSIITKVVQTINTSYLSVAKPDKKLSKIQIDVKSVDEIFSKRFNEEIVKNVNDFYVQTKTKKSIDNVVILQHKTDSVRAAMNGAIYSAVAVVDATPNLNPTRQVQRLAPAQRSQFSAETNKAIYSGLVQNLEMSKLSLMKETPLIQIIDGPIYPLLKQKLGKLKGMVIGGVIFGFLTSFFLLGRRIFRQILNGN